MNSLPAESGRAAPTHCTASLWCSVCVCVFQAASLSYLKAVFLFQCVNTQIWQLYKKNTFTSSQADRKSCSTLHSYISHVTGSGLLQPADYILARSRCNITKIKCNFFIIFVKPLFLNHKINQCVEPHTDLNAAGFLRLNCLTASTPDEPGLRLIEHTRVINLPDIRKSYQYEHMKDRAGWYWQFIVSHQIYYIKHWTGLKETWMNSSSQPRKDQMKFWWWSRWMDGSRYVFSLWLTLWDRALTFF